LAGGKRLDGGGVSARGTVSTGSGHTPIFGPPPATEQHLFVTKLQQIRGAGPRARIPRPEPRRRTRGRGR
jgi:hypothetical protein